MRPAYAGGALQADIAGRLSGVTYHYRVRAVSPPGPFAVGRRGQRLCGLLGAGGSHRSHRYGRRQRRGSAGINPAQAAFSGVRVLRRTDGYPANAADGAVVFDGTGQSCTDPGTGTGSFFYAAFADDPSLHFSAPARAAAMVGVSCEGCHNRLRLRP